MANFTNYIPVYVRTNGNDFSGNGSIGSPFLTAQKAFEYIYNLLNYGYGSNDNYIIDFGIGSFGGVNIGTAGASEWPSYIAVRGVSAKQSFLGGINADAVGDGYNIHILSNQSIHLGNITSAGSYAESNAYSGGTVYLEDCVFGQLLANGGYSENETSGAGGNITLINSIGDNIQANSGVSNGSMTGANGGAGTVVLYRSEVKNISVNAGSSLSPGNGGSVFLYNSRALNISSIGTSSYDAATGNGGYILLHSSTANSIDAKGGLNSVTGSRGLNGSLILTGVSIVPNTIIANIDTSSLFQGFLINNV